MYRYVSNMFLQFMFIGVGFACSSSENVLITLNTKLCFAFYTVHSATCSLALTLPKLCSVPILCIISYVNIWFPKGFWIKSLGLFLLTQNLPLLWLNRFWWYKSFSSLYPGGSWFKENCISPIYAYIHINFSFSVLTYLSFFLNVFSIYS